MIKRIRFVSRRAGLSPDGFAAAFPRAVACMDGVPEPLRPRRGVACTRLVDLGGGSDHDGVSMEWFADLTALRRYEAVAAPSVEPLNAAIEPAATVRLIAEELTLRGAAWLADRWTQGTKFKHMALARRAAGLSPAEFSARWRGKQGTVGAAISIPEEARGRAYVQNHPLACRREWAYDAVNEVYFDDLDALRARIAFFEPLDVTSAEAGFVRSPRFLAVIEHVVIMPHR